jgi:hypothetical protein
MWSGIATFSAICLSTVAAYQAIFWFNTGFWSPISFRLAWFHLFGGLPYWVWSDPNGILLQAMDLPLSLWLSVATALLIAIDLRWRKGIHRKSERQRMQDYAERFKARRRRSL